MASSTLTRTALVTGLTVVAIGAVATAAPRKALTPSPASNPVVDLVSGDSNSVPVSLGVGKSMVIDLPRDVKDVLVADPKIANAVIRSSRRAYLIGVAIGQTNVFFFDGAGRQIVGFDIAVKRDLNGLRTVLRRAVTNGTVNVDAIGDSVVLSGEVATPVDSQQAYDIATRLVGDEKKVVNNITVRGRDQVMLKVTVAEVQRDIVKQLGIDFNGSLGYGTAVVNFNTQNPFGVSGGPLSSTALVPSYVSGANSVSATIRAMERAGVVRTLAEPNLTAVSGETATFIAGGEFPVPNGLSCDTTKSPPICQQQISFKKFGVSLNFTPVVLSGGRISLKVLTEVSDLSTENAITVSQGSGLPTLTIPSVRTRRADTTVEIPSGGSLAMAGMIQQQTKQQIAGVPGLMNLPVLGPLFRSRDYVNNKTELMVLVTPYIVHAVAEKNLSRPDDGFADATDPASNLLGHLNRIYGVSAHPPERPGTYNGKFGFILD